MFPSTYKNQNNQQKHHKKSNFPGLFIQIFILTLFFYGCAKQADLVSKSENEKVVITISGHKPMAFEPWEINMNVKGYSKFDENIEFEFYAGELNKENIEFNWKNDNECTIIFHQQDDTNLTFKLDINESEIHLRRIE